MEQMEIFKTQLDEIESKVNKMLIALMGSDLTNDGGLIKRIDVMEKRIEKISEAQVKLEIYQKLLWVGAGAILLLVIQQIFKIL
jgi:hypothetical protein